MLFVGNFLLIIFYYATIHERQGRRESFSRVRGRFYDRVGLKIQHYQFTQLKTKRLVFQVWTYTSVVQFEIVAWTGGCVLSCYCLVSPILLGAIKNTHKDNRNIKSRRTRHYFTTSSFPLYFFFVFNSNVLTWTTIQ